MNKSVSRFYERRQIDIVLTANRHNLNKITGGSAAETIRFGAARVGLISMCKKIYFFTTTFSMRVRCEIMVML